MRIGTLFFLILLSASFAFAQLENSHIRAGNAYYLDSNFVEAEVQYKKGYAKNQDSYKAAFNIADALYKQGNYKGAISEFEALLGRETDAERLSKIYFNLGNCHMKANEYDQAESQYKNALRKNPLDEEARYNLAYVQQILRQQQDQQNKGGGSDNNEQNKDGDKDSENDDSGEGKNDKDGDKKNENDDKDKKGEGDKKNDQKKNDDKKNSGENKDDKNKQDKNNQQQGNQNQQKQQTISREDMERMLEALKSDEKSVQEKANQEKARQQGKVRVEKDW